MKYLCFILMVFSIMHYHIKAYAQMNIDFEGGTVWSSYNDARIPGNSGSDISLSDDLKEERTYFYRVRAGYLQGKHLISLLYAPLKVKSTGTLDRDVVFEGKNFQANKETKSEFVFNSYRLTYRYNFFHNRTFLIGAGLTGKIRDAKISLENDTVQAEKKNVGFVPLINFSVQWFASSNISLLCDGDALFATQGRAEDIQIAVQYHINKNTTVRIGYRILEGGADNDEVYTFSLFNYALVGLTIMF